MVSEPASLMIKIRDEESYVLVDLRSEAVAAKGHIKGAVNVPAEKLAAAKDSFPSDKDAPIYLYSDETASASAFDIVRGWGYKNASALSGGARGWPGNMFSDPMPGEISYVKKPKAGEIEASEFTRIVEKMPSDKVILDVREGSVPGRLKGAIAIPNAELEDRIGELPRDKEIVIHCNTGILASMAQKVLKDKGYNSRYLNAVIQVGPDGSFEITGK